MNDREFLNHFSSFANNPSNSNGATLSPLPTNSSSFEAGPNPQFPAGYAQPQQSQPQSGNDLQQMFAAQQSKIDALANSVGQLAQIMQQRFSDVAAEPKRESLSEHTPLSLDFPISDEHDLRNAWNLACKTGASSTKKKILSSARKMGLSASLPDSAKQWAQENNIQLFQESEGFQTSVVLSAEDTQLVKSAYNFMSCLKDSELMLTVYGMVKASLSHLSKPDLTQVLSDLTESKQTLAEPSPAVENTLPAESIKPEESEESVPAEGDKKEAEGKEELAAPPVDTVEQIADAVLGVIGSDEFANLIQESAEADNVEVDPDVWKTASSVAKTKGGKEPTKEEIEAIYGVLISAKGGKETSPPSNPLSVFSDLELAKQVYSQLGLNAQPEYVAAQLIRNYSKQFSGGGDAFRFSSDIPSKLALAEELTSLLKRDN